MAVIQSKDRSGWFGASDTSIIMGGWHTKTFARFWLEKQGLLRSNFSTVAMAAGTAFEHPILDHLGIRKRDRQIKIRRLRLRVNLDGETDKIHEVKTYSGDEFKVTKGYWQQSQVEMFAAKKPLEIVAYRLTPDDYDNFYNPIEPDRLSFHPVKYDPIWIEQEYLPRLRYLSKCLRTGMTPDINGVA